MKHIKRILLCLAFGFLLMSSRVFTGIENTGDYIRCSICAAYGAFVVSEWMLAEKEIREMERETEGQKHGRK